MTPSKPYHRYNDHRAAHGGPDFGYTLGYMVPRFSFIVDLREIYGFIADHVSLDTIASQMGIKLFIEDCVACKIIDYDDEEFLQLFPDEAIVTLDDLGVTLPEIRGDFINLYDAVELLVYSKFPKGAIDDFKTYGFKIGKWVTEYEPIFETYTGVSYPPDHPAVSHRTRAESPMGYGY